MQVLARLVVILIHIVAAKSIFASEIDTPTAAQAFGKARPAVTVQPDGLYICEAEEFQPVGENPGWKAQRWGENYYAATFANSFLSRKAFLGAPDQTWNSIATLDVEIAEAGRYLVLVRYEAAFRFETQFRVQIEQDGKTVFERLYGARGNLKIWAFRQKLQKEVGWSWGAVENIVWEGHEAFANLQPGRATLRLLTGPQPKPAARRNIDLVMLTTDIEDVRMRIEKENYLPLDGLLTQSGDVWLRVTNRGTQELTFQGKAAPGGGNWQQHSPYWVHLRNWKVPSITVLPGQTSEWVEVGSVMDSLNDGQWFWTGNGPYQAEFGIRNAAGQIEPLAKFEGEGDLKLAANADTRYSRQLRTLDQVLYDLLDKLKAANPAPHGKAPKRTTIYAQTFEPLDNGRHAKAVAEFKQMFALTDTEANAAGGRGYIDVRGVPTDKLADYCKNLGSKAPGIAVVSLGDEISLPAPRGNAVTEEFRAWLKAQQLRADNVVPGAGDDWSQVPYNPDVKSRDMQPGVYYWSKRYHYHHGIQAIKERTDILRQHLPNAGIGANYSPHYPQEHMFLGEVFKWVSVFRDDGMTLPWSEDYIWQVPVGTPQMNHINFDLFRAANRHHPERKIHYYVMPHAPNNTPNQWRRLFYGALGHGMKIVNLFEFRPVHTAYTENHVDDSAMYVEVLKSFRELGLFEDIIQDGRVRPAAAALWFSETGDIWGDSHGSFAAGKRALYTAIRHQQIPLDFVVEQDALDGTLSQYKVLYLTDAHVSTAASRKIAEWVEKGGVLFATAGAGMYDEYNRPNQTLREVLGIEQLALEEPEDAQVIWIKQDLPFAEPIGKVSSDNPLGGFGNFRGNPSGAPSPVFGVRSRVKLAGAQVLGHLQTGEDKDGRWPGVTQQKVGTGHAIYCAFLPGLSYYRPAIPMRPMDRGATDDAMMHYLPTEFDPLVSGLIGTAVQPLRRPAWCGEPLVETTIIESPHGVAIPLINWTGKPIPGLELTVSIETPTEFVGLASGGKVAVTELPEARVYTFDLGVADALILR